MPRWLLYVLIYLLGSFFPVTKILGAVKGA
jgi:hypothetical protein